MVQIAEVDGKAAGHLNTFMGVFMDDATPALDIADFFASERQA